MFSRIFHIIVLSNTVYLGFGFDAVYLKNFFEKIGILIFVLINLLFIGNNSLFHHLLFYIVIVTIFLRSIFSLIFYFY